MESREAYKYKNTLTPQRILVGFNHLYFHQTFRNHEWKAGNTHVKVKGILSDESPIKDFGMAYMLNTAEEDLRKGKDLLKGEDEPKYEYQEGRLKIVAFGDTIDALSEQLNNKIVVEGDLNLFPFHNGSSTAQISLKASQLVAVLEEIEAEDPEPEIEMKAMERKSQRKIGVKDELVEKLKQNSELSVCIFGPDKQGVHDIFVEFERRNKESDFLLDRYVKLDKFVTSLIPYHLSPKVFYGKLVDKLDGIFESGHYDMLCFSQGGGDEAVTKQLNNKELLDKVLQSPIPICASLGHSDDNYRIWLKQYCDYACTSPGTLVAFLEDVVRVANLPWTIKPERRAQVTGQHSQVVQQPAVAKAPVQKPEAPKYEKLSTEPKPSVPTSGAGSDLIGWIILIVAALFMLAKCS